jgi:hypothetical protein
MAKRRLAKRRLAKRRLAKRRLARRVRFPGKCPDRGKETRNGKHNA